MTWLSEQTVIRARFNGWTATKIKWPSVPFQEPSTAYIAVNILNGEGREATVGSPAQRRHTGVVAVQIFDKENNGTVTLLSLADQLEVLFINQYARLTISPTEYIDFDQPYLTPAETTGGWSQRNFIAPFTRDDFK